MNNSTKIKLVTVALMLAGSVLTVGDKLTDIPGLPGWLVQCWPFVYGGAILFDRIAHILWPDVAPPTPTTPTVKSLVAAQSPGVFSGQQPKL